MKVVAVSGYFDPVHVGHIRMFYQARKMGDKLVVILNNDAQQKLKGSIPFQTLQERIEILNALKPVSNVVVSIDTDATVCKTLALLKPDIFANGGDRKKANTPENEICEKYGIKQVWGVGGEKINSSSTLIKNASQKAVGVVSPTVQLRVSLGKDTWSEWQDISANTSAKK